MELFENYIFNVPILRKIIKLDDRIAHIIIKIQNDNVELLFKNNKQVIGGNDVEYSFISSSDDKEYSLVVRFNNNGKVLGIVSVKPVMEIIRNVTPAAFDSIN